MVSNGGSFDAMIHRLPRRLIKMRLAQVFAILVLVFGPIGNLGALQSLAGDCLSGCPCDAEKDAERCGDERGDAHADADADEHHDLDVDAADDDCGDDCDECDCERGISGAVAVQAATGAGSSIPDARPELARAGPPQGGSTDIFIPPRR